MTSSGELQPLLEALKAVAVALKESGVPFGLAGQFAVYARGGPNSRNDVDFVLRVCDVPAAKEALARRGISTLEPPEDWLLKADHEGVQVDLIHRLASGPVDDEVLGRCDEVSVDSVVMPVVAATDLLASKLMALTEHSCDLGPVLALVRCLREQIDFDEIGQQTASSPFARAALFLAGELNVLPVAVATDGRTRGEST